MSKLPKLSIPTRIDAVDVTSEFRPHLGASVIGQSCKRKIVYDFYWAYPKTVDARLNRIFNYGHATEDMLVEALESININISDSQKKVTDVTGHCGGSIDGLAHGVPSFDEPLLFEAKSMNYTNFNNVKKKQVQEANPGHYVQMQMYMGRLKLNFALYAVMNKNDSHIYTEIVPFDRACFHEHVDLEVDVLNVEHINEFVKISQLPSWFVCKMCGASDVCHKGTPVEQNCRTCDHVEVGPNGIWDCTYVGRNLSTEDQIKGCRNYTVAEMWSK